MKKTTKKAFTLVEMLIVIVIIGILIAALLPRMQGAQGRARDVSRQTNLSQIATAIISSQSDTGKWPGFEKGADGKAATASAGNNAQGGMAVQSIKTDLLAGGMSDVPMDPNGVNAVYGLGAGTAIKGDYLYMVTKKSGAAAAGVVLMASTETEGASNWIVCPATSCTAVEGDDMNSTGCIDSGDDIAKISYCTEFNYNQGGNDCGIEKKENKWTGKCTYNSTSQLRYIYLY